MKDLAAKQAVEHAINKGRGGLFLGLSGEQYLDRRGSIRSRHAGATGG